MNASAGRVRPATSRDLERLAVLFADLVDHHAPQGPAFALRPGTSLAATAREVLRAQLADADARLLCWEQEGELLGFCLARVVRRSDVFVETARGSLDHLWVCPEGRRRGIGRALVRAASVWLRGQGATRLEVCVSRGNCAAAAFWRTLRFRPAMDVLERPL